MPSITTTIQTTSERPSTPTRPSRFQRRLSSSSKVSDWLQTQPYTKTPSHPSASITSSSPSSSQSQDGKKHVEWMGDVIDNEKRPSSHRRSGSSRSIKSSSSVKSSSSSKVRKSTSSSSKCPPAPTFHRLPTPDLSDAGCGDFCDCCPPMSSASRQAKMDAQCKFRHRFLLESSAD